ncbi:MAG TPA: DUF2252 domain-containing protein [Thermoleophilia bacterium]|nr:DUF2252 domain-containing protein [Thermoleophilia bacterium]
MSTTQPWAHQTPEERRAEGKALRRLVPRRAHSDWKPAPDRPDPIALLRAQDADRQQDLVPIRWGRMSASPFTFYRGSAALMAADLAPLPRTGLTVQLCGDAHLSNFGLYASPERAQLFDVNDFDETLPGPFSWDIKRLAASFVLAARSNGFSAEVARDVTLASVRSYREHMAAFAEMREMDVWYSHVVADDLLEMFRVARPPKVVKRVGAGLAKGRTRDSLQAARKLTEVVDGQRRFNDQPPVLMHLDELTNADDSVHTLFHRYAGTLEDDRRELIERFDVLDVARKIVGVGSVGTRCVVVLLRGRDDDDVLILQVKEATRSVLEQYAGKSRYQHSGHRVVAGQQLMQAASDIFLGWMTGPAGRHFYWRQLRDMKLSIDVALLKPPGLELYAEACGWALARGHARSGRRIAIASYMGVGDRFDQGIADFAVAYADQTERDYEVVMKAIKRGKIKVETGV